MRVTKSLFATAVVVLAIALPGQALAQAKPAVTIGLPGIPPVFVSTQAYVAQQEKLFDKYGVNVTLRPFDSGAAAARAVASGDIAISLSPSPLVVNMISNAKVDLVTIYGHEKPDWLIGSLDPAITKCEQIKGLPVGVDSLGGARSIALTQMLVGCKLKADDTQQVAVGTNVHTAMISGQLKVGVLHIDDVPIIEQRSGKKIIPVVDINDVHKINHYMAITTTQKRVAAERDAIVRVLAALIDAQRFMSDPKNAAAVVKAAAVTGRTPQEAEWSIREYLKLEFWPKGHGLSKENIESIIAQQKRVGGIRPDSTPVTYDRYVDLSLYADALKMVK